MIAGEEESEPIWDIPCREDQCVGCVSEGRRHRYVTDELDRSDFRLRMLTFKRRVFIVTKKRSSVRYTSGLRKNAVMINPSI